MQLDRLRRGLHISLRTVLVREWRLFGGMALWLFVYALWTGATGAALSQFASLLDVTLDPWTTETTVAALFAVTLWVLLPAVAATWLVIRELTNVSSNIAEEYRIYPLLLLVPPVVGVTCTLGAVGVVGAESRPLLVAAVVAALFFQIRTLAYSYRVFSGSYPRVQQLSFFVTSAVLLFVLLVDSGIALGQEAFVSDAVTGLGDTFGVTGAGAFVDGTSTVAGLSISTRYGVAIVTPLVLSSSYVSVQFLVGLVVRLRGKAVPRSKLRTGQRYPEFARPTATNQSSLSNTTEKQTATAASTTGGGTDSSATSAGTDSPAGGSTATGTSAGLSDTGDDTSSDSQDQTSEDDQEDISHTRVFTPSATDEQTVVERGEECPVCGADLAAGADSCHSCGTTL